SWRVARPGYGFLSPAVTHFVGISGVGLDSPAALANNPEFARKLGVFGYDRLTKLEDIKDGLSNTIFMIGVPHDSKEYPDTTFLGPWMQGGGSTIRGIPEKDSIKPFVSTQFNGKKGTFAIFCDGSVRFLSDKTSDDVVKALA